LRFLRFQADLPSWDKQEHLFRYLFRRPSLTVQEQRWLFQQSRACHRAPLSRAAERGFPPAR
jgi:hypothetical protein